MDMLMTDEKYEKKAQTVREKCSTHTCSLEASLESVISTSLYRHMINDNERLMEEVAELKIAELKIHHAKIEGVHGDELEQLRTASRRRMAALELMQKDLEKARKTVVSDWKKQNSITLSEHLTDLGRTKGWMAVASAANALSKAIVTVVNFLYRHISNGYQSFVDAKAVYQDRLAVAQHISRVANAHGKKSEESYKTEGLGKQKLEVASTALKNAEEALLTKKAEVTNLESELKKANDLLKTTTSEMKNIEATETNAVKVSHTADTPELVERRATELNAARKTADEVREKFSPAKVKVHELTIRLTEAKRKVALSEDLVKSWRKGSKAAIKEVDEDASKIGLNAMKVKLEQLQGEDRARREALKESGTEAPLSPDSTPASPVSSAAGARSTIFAQPRPACDDADADAAAHGTLSRGSPSAGKS